MAMGLLAGVCTATGTVAPSALAGWAALLIGYTACQAALSHRSLFSQVALLTLS